MQVVVAGRSEDRLSQVVQEITTDGGSGSLCVTDATRAEDLETLLAYAGGLGSIKSVVFNVGNNLPLPFSELTAEQFEEFWRVCTLAGFLTPNFAHFGAAKAALRNMAQALAKDYGPKGIHVGHVVVDGVINGERVRQRFGEYLDAMGEDGSLEPDDIAEAFWFMHSQPRNAWTFEVDVRPFKESW
jgi:NADP-dependent 3-hydroxy acid dehydrogenase YdfG